jgi:hypothetical protein
VRAVRGKEEEEYRRPVRSCKLPAAYIQQLTSYIIAAENFLADKRDSGLRVVPLVKSAALPRARVCGLLFGIGMEYVRACVCMCMRVRAYRRL